MGAEEPERASEHVRVRETSVLHSAQPGHHRNKVTALRTSHVTAHPGPRHLGVQSQASWLLLSMVTSLVSDTNLAAHSLDRTPSMTWLEKVHSESCHLKKKQVSPFPDQNQFYFYQAFFQNLNSMHSSIA